jgi:hypothetical protein
VATDRPFEYRDTRLIVDVLFAIDAKLAEVIEHLVAIRFLLGDEEDGEAEDH